MPLVHIIPKVRKSQTNFKHWEDGTFLNAVEDQVGDVVLSVEEAATLKSEFQWIKDTPTKEHNPKSDSFSPSQLAPIIWIDATVLSAYNLGGITRVNSYTTQDVNGVVFEKTVNNRRPRVDNELTPTQMEFIAGGTPDELINTLDTGLLSSLDKGVVMYVNDGTSRAQFAIGDTTVSNSEMLFGVNAGKAELSFNGGAQVFQSTITVVADDIIEWYSNGTELKVRVNTEKSPVVEVFGSNIGQWISSLPSVNQMAIGKNVSLVEQHWNTTMRELFIRKKRLNAEERGNYADYITDKLN